MEQQSTIFKWNIYSLQMGQHNQFIKESTHYQVYLTVRKEIQIT
jgi:hypothetical protein